MKNFQLEKSYMETSFNRPLSSTIKKQLHISMFNAVEAGDCQ